MFYQKHPFACEVDKDILSHFTQKLIFNKIE